MQAQRFIPVVVVVLVIAYAASVFSQTPPPRAAPLSVEEVIKLYQAGFSEEVIITRIKRNGKAFDLSTEELVELRKAGLTDNIIKYLLDPSQPYAPPAPPPPPAPVPPAPSGASETPAAAPAKAAAPPKEYPPDEFAAKAPWSPGVYRFSGEIPAPVDIKMLLGVKEGPGLGKVLMKKGKTVAYLVGPSAKTRIREPAPVFYFRLPEGKGIEEVVLAAFERKSDRRELEMEAAGPKPEAMRPFDSVEVGQRLFRVVPAKLTKGEYLFYLIGSAEPPKGSYGKGYDFGIDETKAASKRQRK